MGTHNICFHKEVDKKYTGCNLKTTAWLVCALIGMCAVIRLNMVIQNARCVKKYGVGVRGGGADQKKKKKKKNFSPRNTACHFM